MAPWEQMHVRDWGSDLDQEWIIAFTSVLAVSDGPALPLVVGDSTRWMFATSIRWRLFAQEVVPWNSGSLTRSTTTDNNAV